MNTFTEAEVRELLEAQKVWLRALSWRYFAGKDQGSDENRADIRQEGYQGMWEAIQNFDGTGTLEGWMRQNARWKMNVFMTRYTRHPEPAVDAEDFVWEALFASADLDGVFTAYHHGEVMEAINSLSPTQKEYVYRRFWLGQLQPEICEAMGIHNPMHLWSRPKYGAKPKLAKLLGHLVEV